MITAIGTGDGEGKNVSGSVFEGRVKGKVKEGIMAYQEEYQHFGTKRQDIKAYLKQRGQHLRDWLELLREVISGQ